MTIDGRNKTKPHDMCLHCRHEANNAAEHVIKNVSCIPCDNQSTTAQPYSLRRKTTHTLLLCIVFGTVSRENVYFDARKASIHHMSAQILFWTTRHAHFHHHAPRQCLTQRCTTFTLHCRRRCTCFHHVFMYAMCNRTSHAAPEGLQPMKRRLHRQCR